jgi:hypothetical protein
MDIRRKKRHSDPTLAGGLHTQDRFWCLYLGRNVPSKNRSKGLRASFTWVLEGPGTSAKGKHSLGRKTPLRKSKLPKA